MSDDLWKAYTHGMAAALGGRGVYLPSLLLKSAAELGLNHSEVMLLLQILICSEGEGNDFPTPVELAEVMGSTSRQVEGWLGRLIKDGFLSIDDFVEPGTGIQGERYNWSGWLMKAAEWETARKREARKSSESTTMRKTKPKPDTNLFSVFEQEFGRLLSPMECETISAWLDQDNYSEEIILFALKESVFAGKLSLRYIDRILMEWSRNRITNAEEARAHASKFHGGRG
ncbi:DNA replication protein DnaD [Paenibacillus oryzae]|uniref:DNA replication protein DnaD n=1 Tax=Paenibacillus oryzae TaxID=1844972 RepID=A0A1A5YHA0_9BACL|nr:DnaD domain protein [Paenibacillus oryzae]OBR64780.1 DNA replication protein DnaD [Paenibacillus oryzae]